ncbi:Oxygen-independent coproporphyrinogen-III oxidase 2 [Fusobacterium necrogenes]|uniref:Oxygen-independent coproporphyrinogen-III oxidase 2 n=1 Tax=Fusobacterium necrogenes TaxID=858 RepID=A0A377GVI1_9FUSO|nr:radical SAM protein [Fusobacterium necrogenes]STO30742.1 Oxygen-independent coproporphyrinogen-III oxidase 2 [Fusobacterium necrogenes]
MKHYNIPIFISHFGCPNSCVFCNQKKINGRETDVTIEDLKNTIEMYLETLPKNSKKEVAFFGGTFTGISMKLQEEYLKTVYEYIKKGDINGIRLSTRPDYINDEIVAQLKKYGVTAIELGVQSLDKKVLLATERFYPVEIVEEACKIIKKYEIDLGIQLMIGLPKSTFESDYLTAVKILDMKPEMARIYPTLVIKNTKMAQMFFTGEYHALTLDEAVERTRKIYSLLESEGINIIRVGLQPSEDLRENGVVIAGPFHPAFREVVETEIYYDFFRKILENEKKLDIFANEKSISKLLGIKKVNRIRLKKYFHIDIDNSIDRNDVIINGRKYSRLDVLRGELTNESNSNQHR